MRVEKSNRLIIEKYISNDLKCQKSIYIIPVQKKSHTFLFPTYKKKSKGLIRLCYKKGRK